MRLNYTYMYVCMYVMYYNVCTHTKYLGVLFDDFLYNKLAHYLMTIIMFKLLKTNSCNCQLVTIYHIIYPSYSCYFYIHILYFCRLLC